LVSSEKDIILQRKVGEGAYGSVFLAEFNGYPVACKIIKSGITQDNAKKILDELRVMRRLKHPNVVLLMGACLNAKNQIMIVTEFAARYVSFPPPRVAGSDLTPGLEGISNIVLPKFRPSLNVSNSFMTLRQVTNPPFCACSHLFHRIKLVATL
jgi:serine/threonine protein kinase